jgi:predicted double-glycine peptidase
MLLKDVPYYAQKRDYTCGPACLKMVLDYLGVESHQEILGRMAQSNEDVGTNYQGMVDAVRFHYRRSFVKKGASIEDIRHFLDMHLPIIVNWYLNKEKVGHFSVVVGISDKFITLNDPFNGERIRKSIDKFLEVWHDSTGRNWNWMMVVFPKRIRVKTPPGRIYYP